MARLGILLAAFVIAGCSTEFPTREPAAAIPETELVDPPLATIEGPTGGIPLPGENLTGRIADVMKDASGKCQATILVQNAAGRQFAVEVHRRGDGQLLAREEFTGKEDVDLRECVIFEHSGALRDLQIQLMAEPEGTILDQWGN